MAQVGGYFALQSWDNHGALILFWRFCAHNAIASLRSAGQPFDNDLPSRPLYSRGSPVPPKAVPSRDSVLSLFHGNVPCAPVDVALYIMAHVGTSELGFDER